MSLQLLKIFHLKGADKSIRTWSDGFKGRLLAEIQVFAICGTTVEKETEYIFFLYNLAPTATCSSHKTHSPSVSISEQKLLCTPGYITTVPSETRQWYQSSFFQLICGCFLLLVQECAASCPTPTSCSPNSQLGHQSQQDSACWVTVAALQHLLTLFVWELWTLYHKNGGGNSACTFPGVFFFCLYQTGVNFGRAITSPAAHITMPPQNFL